MSGKAGQKDNLAVNPSETCAHVPLSTPGRTDGKASRAEHKSLLLKSDQLDKDIAKLLKEIKEQSEAKSYVDLLHEYNDVKDATQLVLGNLARLENVSVTALHKQFGLSYTDNDA